MFINLKKRLGDMSVYKFSEMSGVSSKTLYRLVNKKVGSCKFITLDKIAKALDVSIDELFDREDPSDEGSC